MNILRLSLLLFLSTASFAQITDFLRVEGRDVVDEQNQVVELRGINMDAEFWAWDWDTTRHNTYADAADIRFLDSLGANVIRLCLNYNYFASSDGFNFIDNYLSWCDTSGIYMLLDMHVVPEGNGIFTNPAAEQQLVDIWQSIAARYRDEPAVLGYDLMNEPWPNDAAVWYAFAGRLVDSIRTVDTTHIIMVENTLSGETFQLIDDPNILYSYHDYSPFAVTHAAATWVGETPVTDQYEYPGEVLTSSNWLGYSEDQPTWTTSSPNWRYWDSGNLIAPSGADYAYVKPNVYGNVENVYYDDLGSTKNGASFSVFNGGIEEASSTNSSEPSMWFFLSSGTHSGSWSTTAHSGLRSLSISGTNPNGWAVWGQSAWILTAPFIPVVPGDTLRATGWIHAANLGGGGVSLGFDYISAVTEHYDRAHLLDDIQYLLNWSEASNKPIWCGEFGCMSAAPNGSQERLVRDKISVMNEAGLGWAMWSYRAYEPPSFTLFYGDSVDVPLTNVIALGFAGRIHFGIQDLTIWSDGQSNHLRWSPIEGAVGYVIYASPVYSENLQDYTIIGTTTASPYVIPTAMIAQEHFVVIPQY
ncbi:MAG: cellulase family glycosylhydrolase [Calditrichaeota bacterium]|nr:cellulase family glycosylhydrolase [Calditrichota bacterium]MCB9391352.1 cellulase family glycosylhydrolase [Calditrichota bacterium]